jgi:hypothetical protein
MHSTSQSEGSRAPRTIVGLWLRANWRGDDEGHQRLDGKLNRGQKGWNDDEPAVVEAVCQLAVRRFFGVVRDRDTGKLVSVEEFVSDLLARISKTRMLFGQEDAEAVIRAALDDSAEVPPHIGRGELLGIRGVAAFSVTQVLKFDAEDCDHLIVEAEDLAIARGYSPPLVMDL